MDIAVVADTADAPGTSEPAVVDICGTDEIILAPSRGVVEKLLAVASACGTGETTLVLS